jgi:formamidase
MPGCGSQAHPAHAYSWPRYGTPLAEGSNRPDEIITCELRPDLVREARAHWGVENNIYQFGHRGYVAVKGGARRWPRQVYS